MTSPLEDDPELCRLAGAFLKRARELGALAGVCMAVTETDGYTLLGGEFYDDTFGVLIQQFADLRRKMLQDAETEDAETAEDAVDAPGLVH